MTWITGAVQETGLDDMDDIDDMNDMDDMDDMDDLDDRGCPGNWPGLHG